MYTPSNTLFLGQCRSVSSLNGVSIGSVVSARFSRVSKKHMNAETTDRATSVAIVRSCPLYAHGTATGNAGVCVQILTDMAKQTIIYVKCCAGWFVCLSVFLFIAFV